MNASRDAILAAGRELLAQGRNGDELLLLLRQSGCSKIDSIKMLMELTGQSLAQAKRLVHHSNVWSDVREQDEAFHELLERSYPERHSKRGANP